MGTKQEAMKLEATREKNRRAIVPGQRDACEEVLQYGFFFQQEGKSNCKLSTVVLTRVLRAVLKGNRQAIRECQEGRTSRRHIHQHLVRSNQHSLSTAKV